MKSNETIVTNTRRPSRIEDDDDEDTAVDDDDMPFSALSIGDDLIPLPGLINGALP